MCWLHGILFTLDSRTKNQSLSPWLLSPRERRLTRRVYWGMILTRTFDRSGRTWTAWVANESACALGDSNDPQTLCCIQGTGTDALPYATSCVLVGAMAGWKLYRTRHICEEACASIHALPGPAWKRMLYRNVHSAWLAYCPSFYESVCAGKDSKT